MGGNKPPYTITEKAASYLAKILETVTQLELGSDFKRHIRLHRENRMRTIYSSLAIEGNPLSLGEVNDVIKGKAVAGTVLLAIKNGSLSRKEIFYAIDMNNDTRSFKRNIEPLIAGGLIELTVPDKPNRKLQKYRPTNQSMGGNND